MKIPLPKFQQKQPTIIQDFQEVTIALFSANLQPDAITEKILKEKQIIPKKWKLTQPKLIKPNLKQFIFKNGFKIQIQPGKIYFTTPINQRRIAIDQIVSDFVNSFPEFIYNNWQIIPQRLISLPGNLNAAQQFITENFLLEGEWQNFHDIKPKVKLQFFYTINNSSLILEINDVQIKNQRKNFKSALIFRGIFYKNLPNKARNINSKNLIIIIKKYEEYLVIFNKIFNKFFSD
jgi:hypothetical protein